LKKYKIVETKTLVTEIEVTAESMQHATELYMNDEFGQDFINAEIDQWNVVDTEFHIEEPIVTIYYNDVFVSDTPNEIYKDCPYVNVGINDAIEYADNKIENGDWDAYCIPEMLNHNVIFHNE
jgi:hypothetical protein